MYITGYEFNSLAKFFDSNNYVSFGGKVFLEIRSVEGRSQFMIIDFYFSGSSEFEGTYKTFILKGSKKAFVSNLIMARLNSKS